MAGSFRGTDIGITELVISGREMHVRVVFQDKDGVVHGHVEHRLPVAETPEIQEPAQRLLEAVTNLITKYHFEHGPTMGAEEARAGIAEALRTEPDYRDA